MALGLISAFPSLPEGPLSPISSSQWEPRHLLQGTEQGCAVPPMGGASVPLGHPPCLLGINAGLKSDTVAHVAQKRWGESPMGPKSFP